jgi:PP-loop superfamily ATP-utilizing enzyme
VEVGPDEVERLLEEAESVASAVKAAGYSDVILDRRGYRRGGARLPLLES